MTDVAFEPASIPGLIGRPAFAVPFEEIVGDHAVGVALAECFEDGFAVDVLGVGAGARFEVVGYAAGGGEAAVAEGAGDVGSLVGTRAHVLWNS